MLALKRVKFRKRFKGRTKGMATRGNTVAFGHYGLMALEPGWISYRQIEASRQGHTRDEARRQSVDPAVPRQADHEEAGRDPDGEGQGESRRLGGGGEAGPGDVRARGDRRESGARGAGARGGQAADQVEVREAGGALACRGRSPR